MEPTSDPTVLVAPRRAMTIGAHPDDAEFGAGGTIARWTASGCQVLTLVVTDGSKGTWEDGLDPADLVDLRREEQHRSAKVLGVAETVMLDHPDGELEYTLALREQLCLWVRRFRPNVVLTHDPWRRYMLHPDHRVTGWAALDAVVAARDHLFYPDQLTEGVTKHRPDALLLWATDEPDYWEDVSETIDQKVEALLCHSSQAATTMGKTDAAGNHQQDFADRIRAWATDQGRAAGLDLAESFKRITP